MKTTHNVPPATATAADELHGVREKLLTAITSAENELSVDQLRETVEKDLEGAAVAPQPKSWDLIVPTASSESELVWYSILDLMNAGQILVDSTGQVSLAASEADDHVDPKSASGWSV